MRLLSLHQDTKANVQFQDETGSVTNTFIPQCPEFIGLVFLVSSIKREHL
jgi:hypothetical protein